VLGTNLLDGRNLYLEMGVPDIERAGYRTGRARARRGGPARRRGRGPRGQLEAVGHERARKPEANTNALLAALRDHNSRTHEPVALQPSGQGGTNWSPMPVQPGYRLLLRARVDPHQCVRTVPPAVLTR
jgi:hypothetical protein